MFKKFLSPDKAGLVLLIMVCVGCSSAPQVMLTANGTLADISHTDGRLENVELLAMQNDTLFVLGDSFIAIPQSSLLTVSLRIREKRGWMYYVVLAQVLPAAALALTQDQTAQTVGVILGGLAVGTWAALEFSGPQSVFKFPLDDADSKSLALHLRFPYGVQRNQLDQINAVVWRSVP